MPETDPASGSIGELKRLAALRASGLLDSPSELGFDRLTRLASRLLRAPVALVSLVDADRQFFKSSVGLGEPLASARGTPLSLSLCKNVVATGRPLVIEDARATAEFRDHGATREMGVVAYLGVPLFSEGAILGTFCAIDGAPRAWTEEDVGLLRDLAESVMSEITLRIEKVELVKAEARQAAQHAAALILAEAPSLDAAIGPLLAAVGDRLGFDIGEFWGLDPARGRLQRSASDWSSGRVGPGFAEASRAMSFGPGEGLPGRVWASMEPDWIEDVAADPHFRRIAEAARAGLACAAAAPIAGQSGPIGVIAFLARGPMEPDPALLRVLATLGRQVGQFAERRQAEARLLENQARLRGILEASLEGLITIDHEGLVVEFNPAAERIFGFERAAVLGRRLSDLIIPPEHREAHAAGLRSYLETGQSRVIGRRIELEAIRADGSRFPIELAIGVIETGGSPLFTASLRDIGDRKRDEEEIRRAKEQAEAASRAKGEFLANMSHEVRTPMAAVLGYADMLLDPGLSRAARDGALQAIRRNGSHLLQLISDILDLSKVEAGEIELDRVAYSPWRLTLEVVSALRGLAVEKGVALQAHAVGRLPGLGVMDPTRVRQVLMNLVGNAIKFSGPGSPVSIRVGVDAEGPGGAGGATLRLEVEDRGIGMTAEQVGQVFAPFRQADASTTRKFGGTGLGLSISRRLVEAMGGSIAVASQFGRGSRFAVSLPIAVEPGAAGWIEADELALAPRSLPPAAGPDDRPAPPMLAGRVLLAEDSPDNRRVLLYHLRRMGLDVEAVENGRDAVDRALVGGFDLVLMDMQMPVLDGYDATRSLRRSGSRVPIIALTAHALIEDREKCLRAGCAEYLTKPVEPRVLARVLARFLPPADARGAPAAGFADDPELARLVAEYVAGLPGQVAGLRRSLAAGDLGGVEFLAHRIRGVGGMYGFAALTELAGLVEQAARERRDADLLVELLDELGDLIAREVARPQPPSSLE